MARRQTNPVAISVGFFILTGVLTLVFGVFWLKAITTRPAYTFNVAYNAPDHLDPGAQVYYRGVEVGRVMKVRLSDDYRYTLVTIGIRDSGLKLSRDVQVKIRLEGLTGERYVDISTPDPDVYTASAIHNGDTIIGTEGVGWEAIQKELNEIVQKRTIEKTLLSAQHAIHNLELASASVNDLVQTSKPEVVASLKNIWDASSHINTAVDHVAPRFENTLDDVSSGISHLDQKTENLDTAITSVKQAADQMNQTMGTINDQLESTQVISKVAATSQKISNGVGVINRAIGAPKSDAVADGTQNNPVTENNARAFGCTLGHINYILKQRFLLFRLMFGKPGGQYTCPAGKQAPSPAM